MKTIDVKWMQKIDAVHDKLERSIPLGSKTRRCTKEILIDRYFKFLHNQAFKIQIPEEGSNYRKEEDIKYRGIGTILMFMGMLFISILG